MSLTYPVYTVDGVCGSYKTSRLIEWADTAIVSRNPLLNKIVVASPALKLVEQSYKTALSRGMAARRFDSSTHPEEVYAELLRFMKEPHDDGVIVFVTHKTLIDMPYWGEHRADWNLVVDEIPQVDGDYCWNLKERNSYDLLMHHVESRDLGQNLYLRLVPKPDSDGYLRRIAANARDDTVVGWMVEFRNLCNDLLCEHREVWVSRASWNRLKFDGAGQVHIHTVLKPSVLEGWASVQMMGANFRSSVLAMVWEAQGVEFRPSKRIVPDAAVHGEELGRRITLHYFSANRWSSTLFAKLGEGARAEVDAKAVEAIHPVIATVFGDADFLYALNNNIPDKTIGDRFPNAVRVPNNPHGLNSFTEFHNAVYLTCLNNRTPHFAFLNEMYGIDGDALAAARYYEFAYQFFMRSSGRVKDADAPLKFIIPDIDAANHFVNVFPGCRLKAIETPPALHKITGSASKARGRPRKVKPASVVDRKAKSRAKLKEIEVTKNTLLIRYFSSRKSGVHFTHAASVFSKSLLEDGTSTWDEFRVAMRQMSETYVPKKEEATLISGASFERIDGVDTGKGLANVVLVNGIWFDIDDGEMTPRDWRALFPEHKLLAFNSWNNGKEGKLKYRVLFPTSEPVSADEYHAIWDAMMRRISQAGFYVGTRANFVKRQGSRVFSGIDISKRTANSMFYLPSRAGLGMKHSFWVEQWGDEHRILDPSEFLEFMPVERRQPIMAPARQSGQR